MLSVIMLSVVMLSVIMLSVVMLNVVAPQRDLIMFPHPAQSQHRGQCQKTFYGRNLRIFLNKLERFSLASFSSLASGVLVRLELT
jgi:hypothetical protein